MEIEPSSPLPAGVMVVRAVSLTSDDTEVLFRMTSGAGTQEEPHVSSVRGAAALHDAIDAWLATLDGEAIGSAGGPVSGAAPESSHPSGPAEP